MNAVPEEQNEQVVDIGIAQGVGRENEIYTRRFSDAEEATRRAVWKVLTAEYFQNFISHNDTVVDIGAGDGHFIKNIKAKRRVAVDLSPHVQALTEHGIEVHQIQADKFCDTFVGEADVVFMSNFLEHLPDKRTLLAVLEECRKALKPGGSIIILQPNIRLVGTAYWDYIDHHISLTEHSLVEGLEVSGFTIVDVIARFLPYTAKSRTGRFLSGERAAVFTQVYLKFPLLWKLFGKQSLVIATPDSK